VKQISALVARGFQVPGQRTPTQSIGSLTSRVDTALIASDSLLARSICGGEPGTRPA
jgi:hypothetical protein